MTLKPSTVVAENIHIQAAWLTHSRHQHPSCTLTSNPGRPLAPRHSWAEPTGSRAGQPGCGLTQPSPDLLSQSFPSWLLAKTLYPSSSNRRKRANTWSTPQLGSGLQHPVHKPSVPRGSQPQQTSPAARYPTAITSTSRFHGTFNKRTSKASWIQQALWHP